MNKVYFKENEHRFYLDEGMTQSVPSVSYLLSKYGYSNFDELKRLGLKDVIEAAADYGSKVHETLQLYDEGTLESFDESILGEVTGWRKFLADYKPEFLIIEEPLVSKVWGFAGILDRYWLDNLCDIKTGTRQVAHEIQTAFYKILVEENFPTFKVKNRFTVELKGDGYKIIQHKNRNDEGVVKAIMTIYSHQKKAGL